LKTITHQQTAKIHEIVETAWKEGKTSLLEPEAEQLAKAYGLQVPPSALAVSEAEAVRFAKKIGFPLVMKIVSPDILHKSDAGGVFSGIASVSEASKAYQVIIKNAKKANAKARIDGVLVQKMAPKANEFVVGGVRDPQFGPTIMFGLGGIYVELFKDVAFRLAPVSKSEALSMMGEIKSSKLLTGFRGSEPLDQDSAAKAISAVGKMMIEMKKIESIDINPLFIYPKGSIAVDVRIILSKAS
jgi:acetate---CoA ligase (ADP-forming) subunit beta